MEVGSLALPAREARRVLQALPLEEEARRVQEAPLEQEARRALGGAAGPGGAAGSAGGAGRGGAPASGWSMPLTIGDAVAQGRIPAVAVSGIGDAFIAFEGSDGSWVQRYTKASDTLEAPTRIDAPNGNVLIAADDAGGALVIAQRHQTYAIVARRFEAGSTSPGGWGVAHEIQATEGGGPGHSAVVHELSDLSMTGSGHAVVAWNRWDSATAPEASESYLSVYDAGRGWDAARRFSASGATSERTRCAIAESGQSLKIFAAMSVYDVARDGTDVWVNDMTYDRVTGVGVVGAPRVLLPLTGDSWGFSEAVAADPAGNFFTAIFQRGPYGSLGDRVLVASEVGGTWAMPMPLNTGSGVDQLTLSVGRNGEAIALWNQCPASRCGMRARRFVGGAWGPETALSPPISNPPAASDVAVDGRGRVLAVWVEHDEASAQVVVRARELDPASGWTAPHSIGAVSSSTETIQSVSVAFGANGTGVAAWGIADAGSAPIPSRRVQAAIFRD